MGDVRHDFGSLEGENEGGVVRTASTNTSTLRKRRREPVNRRRLLSRKSRRPKIDGLVNHHIVPAGWWFLAIAIAVAAPFSAFITRSFPTPEIAIFILIAFVFAWLSRKVGAIERSRHGPSHIWKLIAWSTIVVPVAGFAIAEMLWVHQIGMGLPWMVAALLTMNMLCHSLLSERPVQQIFCIAASWGIVAIAVGTFEAICAFVATICFSIVIGHHQAKVAIIRLEARLARERERHRAEHILRDYEETGQGWFWETDRRGLVSYLSPAIIEALGRMEQDIIGRPFLDLFHGHADTDEGLRTLSFNLSSRSSFQDVTLLADSNGEELWWCITGLAAYDDFHNFIGFRGSGTDLTEKRRSEAHTARLAQYDALTGLANRASIHETLEEILATPLESHRECSVFLIDLDRFKQVNDTFGHPVGDDLLKQVAQRLELCVGSDGRVGRLGGDEFMVVLSGRGQRETLLRIARKIIHEVSLPFMIEGQRVAIGASIGIAVAPDNGNAADTMMRNADLALYAAKGGGRGRFHFYSHDLHASAQERENLEKALRVALEKGEMHLYYQPVIQIEDDYVAGFEASLHWKHTQHGYLPPDKFIPLAENTGMAGEIGEWALRKVCADLSNWPKHIRCAVNISPSQFANPKLPEIISGAILDSRIDPYRLVLEISEDVFAEENSKSETMFTELRNIGVRLTLDDFGTGNSSLATLKNLPFHVIKIDPSFVRSTETISSTNGAIIAAITSFARSLGINTIAQGVETMDELALVRSLGCTHVQGSIYAEAVDCHAATELANSNNSLTAQGPQSMRAPRHSMLRAVRIDCAGKSYEGTIRNIAEGGAVIEGLRSLPDELSFTIAFTANVSIRATSIWCDEGRMGVKFVKPLNLAKVGLVSRPVSLTHQTAKRYPVRTPNVSRPTLSQPARDNSGVGHG